MEKSISKIQSEVSESAEGNAFDMYKDLELPDDEDKDYNNNGQSDLLGTICEVVMSEMYDHSSIGDIENESDSISQSSNEDDSDGSLMNKLNKVLAIKNNSHISKGPGSIISKKLTTGTKNKVAQFGPRALRDFNNDGASNYTGKLSTQNVVMKISTKVEHLSLSASSKSSQSLSSKHHLEVAQTRKLIEKSKLSINI